MTATEIIRQIEALPPEEQAKVVQFAYRLDARRKLSGGELSDLAGRLVVAQDPSEAAALRAAIVQGFHGDETTGEDLIAFVDEHWGKGFGRVR